MKNYLKHIDDFFREKLGRYSEPPPADVWESLEGRLDGLVPSPQVPGNAFRLLKHFGMVSLIAVLGVSLVKSINSRKTKADIAKNEQTVAAASEATIAANTEDKNEQSHTRTSTTETPVTASGNPVPVTAAPYRTAYAMNAAKQTTAGKVKRYAHNTNARKRYTAEEENMATDRLFKEQADKRISHNKNSLALPGPIDETESSDEAVNGNMGAHVNDQKKTELSKDKKKEEQLAETQIKKKDNEYKLPGKFEAGIKAGYERGFNDLAATKYAIAPYVKYKLNDKFSLMAQPAVKYASVNKHNVGKAQSYYTVNNDGTVTQKGSSTATPVIVGGTIVDMRYTTTYTYTQSHDSVVKSYTHGGSYMEFELPLMVSYAVVPQLSVYGGVNINYSKQTAITEHTYTKQGIVKAMDSTTTTSGAAAPLAIKDVITYTGYSYSDYKAPVYTNSQTSSIKLGYMIGFSYEYSNKWLFDAAMQQTPMKPYLQGGYNVNSTLSAPYFRLSVGYKLTK